MCFHFQNAKGFEICFHFQIVKGFEMCFHFQIMNEEIAALKAQASKYRRLVTYIFLTKVVKSYKQGGITINKTLVRL